MLGSNKLAISTLQYTTAMEDSDVGDYQYQSALFSDKKGILNFSSVQTESVDCQSIY